jgi:hypothetical protein
MNLAMNTIVMMIAIISITNHDEKLEGLRPLCFLSEFFKQATVCRIEFLKSRVFEKMHWWIFKGKTQ